MVIHSSRGNIIIKPETSKKVEEPKTIILPKKERKRPEPKIEEPIVKVEEIVKEEIENIVSEDIDVLTEEK